MTARASDAYDVAIVGAGPTGIIAANLCGVYGLSAIALDREADVYDLPRAVAMWDDVQRILHNAGVFEETLPATCTHVGAEFVDRDGKRIIGIEIPADFVTANGYTILRGFHQPGFERAARTCLSRHRGVRLALRHEVQSVAQAGDGATLGVRDLVHDVASEVRARWVIACDGASSSLRKASGIAWESLGYDCDWLVVDVRLKCDVALPRSMTQVCDPARPATVIPLPLRMHRWEFQLRPGETRAEMEDPRRIWELLAPWLSPDDAEIVRGVVYRFHATIAARFRHGRVFLAGDAAHQTPPFMGQGLCSGVRDAHNLIWKIAEVTRGRSPDALLDTYEEERRPMALAAVEHSVNTGKLIDAYAAMGDGAPPPPPELREYAYGGRAQLPDLSTGLLARQASDWIGRLVPQCAIATPAGPVPVDDLVGPRWAILSASEPRQQLGAAAVRTWEEHGAVLATVADPHGFILGPLLAHPVLVVRPDRVIAAVDPEISPATLLAERRGAG
jgi:3-(3-hydroxy-phenyl)propionate hydroxylase